ncbi:MAG TPA: hypothetical protein VIH36_02265 [Casimicrobiaceae bacterium]|jgi:hypothetical protein
MHDRKHRDLGVKPSTSTQPTQPAASFAISSRRRFLFALGASSAAAASVGTLAAASPAPATVAGTPVTSQGYRETAHVRDYYASARH